MDYLIWDGESNLALYIDKFPSFFFYWHIVRNFIFVSAAGSFILKVCLCVHLSVFSFRVTWVITFFLNLTPVVISWCHTWTVKSEHCNYLLTVSRSHIIPPLVGFFDHLFFNTNFILWPFLVVLLLLLKEKKGRSLISQTIKMTLGLQMNTIVKIEACAWGSFLSLNWRFSLWFSFFISND